PDRRRFGPMSDYYGDIAPGQTIRIPFGTNTGAGAPITLAGTPSAAVYKDGNTTEGTTGASLSVDFDGKTGTHRVIIDTSADAVFYSAGSDFVVQLAAGTVNGQSVAGTPLGSFSILNRSAIPSTIAAAVFAFVVENGKSFIQVLRGIFAAAKGKASG